VTRAVQILRILGELRLTPQSTERQLCDRIEDLLKTAWMGFQREARIAPRCRVDFLVDGIAIECKKGKPSSKALADQVRRYCRRSAVRALIMVIERNVAWHLDKSGGKRVYYLSLNRLWGIAL
jgi:hypothetical protein